MNEPVPALEPAAGPAILTMEQTRLWVLEGRLNELFRVLVAHAERPGPVRRDLIDLARQVQRLQAKTVAEARRR